MLSSLSFSVAKIFIHKIVKTVSGRVLGENVIREVCHRQGGGVRGEGGGVRG